MDEVGWDGFLIEILCYFTTLQTFKISFVLDLNYNIGSYKLDPSLKRLEGNCGTMAPAPSPSKSVMSKVGNNTPISDGTLVKRSQGRIKTVPLKTLEMVVQPMV